MRRDLGPARATVSSSSAITTGAGRDGPAQTAYPRLIESMRAIERGARERSAVFELVVYPYAEHGFNLQRSAYYRGDDEANAWKRTVDMLRRYQPLR